VVSAAAPATIPAPRVTVIDTAGAGDVFCGVFVAGLARGLAPVPAARPAVEAASLSVTRQGTQSSFPTGAEIARFLKNAAEGQA